MSTHEVPGDDSTGSASVPSVDMKLEVVVIPVSEVDRAKEFYSRLGWRLDADRSAGTGFRLIQFTPPGSGCAVQFGVNLTSASPGSAQALLLIVSDIEAARRQLIANGADASDVFHCASGTGCRFPGIDVRVSGPHPERLSYGSFVSFKDPDGNSWLLQEVTKRLAGRVAGDTTRIRRRATSPRRWFARRRRTESMKRGLGKPTQTGQIGTPSTWCASSLARSCRNSDYERSSVWHVSQAVCRRRQK
jgi:catechol 2,3-dioxygenase-like lactoylglutathione lyase family enzyme